MAVFPNANNFTMTGMAPYGGYSDRGYPGARGCIGCIIQLYGENVDDMTISAIQVGIMQTGIHDLMYMGYIEYH